MLPLDWIMQIAVKFYFPDSCFSSEPPYCCQMCLSAFLLLLFNSVLVQHRRPLFSPRLSSYSLNWKHPRFCHDSDILEPRHPFMEQDPTSNDHSRSGLHRLLGAAVGLKVGVCEVFGLSSDWGIVGGSVRSDAWSPGVWVDMHKS